MKIAILVLVLGVSGCTRARVCGPPAPTPTAVTTGLGISLSGGMTIQLAPGLGMGFDGKIGPSVGL